MPSADMWDPSGMSIGRLKKSMSSWRQKSRSKSHGSGNGGGHGSGIGQRDRSVGSDREGTVGAGAGAARAGTAGTIWGRRQPDPAGFTEATLVAQGADSVPGEVERSGVDAVFEHLEGLGAVRQVLEAVEHLVAQ